MSYHTLIHLILASVPGFVENCGYWVAELLDQMNVGSWRVALWDLGRG
jgi:hypothetical protein